MNRQKKIHAAAWPLWILPVAALVLVSGWILSGWGSASGQSTPGTPGGSNADQNFIQGLQQIIGSGRISDADRQALQKKLEYNQRLADQPAAQPAARRPKGPPGPPVRMPESLAASNIEQGERIIPGSEGMVHSWEASINNLWEGSWNGVQYLVLAGSAPDDPAQGLIIVMEFPSGQALPIRNTYLASPRSGSLTIVERQGGRLRCSTAGGSGLDFDLETRRFQ